MAHIDSISGKPRSELGSTACRKLRSQGMIPCNVYGHKQETASIVLTRDAAEGLARSGTLVLDLEVSGKTEKALVKQIQWDTFSNHVMHVDFLRVDANERIKLDVPLQIRGSAPGVVAGGVLEVHHHNVTIECLAVEVPDFLVVKVGSLEIGQAIHVKDLSDVPPGVTLLSPAEQVLVQVVIPKVVDEPVAEAAAAGEGAQPDLVKPPAADKEKKDSK